MAGLDQMQERREGEVTRPEQDDPGRCNHEGRHSVNAASFAPEVARDHPTAGSPVGTGGGGG